MTTELEKQFFDTFEIEPKKIYLCPHCKTKLGGCTWVGDEQRFECLYSWGEHPYYMGKEVEEKAIIDYEYPQITDRHYLELISAQLRVDKLTNVTFAPNNTHTSTIKGLQELILGGSILCYKTLLKNNFIKAAEDYKHQVQQLFI